uniref:Ground-like domain-containing protein n=1 Tax=Panagrellus redivivus TaxID=6233 RepID=A0A7E4VRD3_PANRE
MTTCVISCACQGCRLDKYQHNIEKEKVNNAEGFRGVDSGRVREQRKCANEKMRKEAWLSQKKHQLADGCEKQQVDIVAIFVIRPFIRKKLKLSKHIRTCYANLEAEYVTSSCKSFIHTVNSNCMKPTPAGMYLFIANSKTAFVVQLTFGGNENILLLAYNTS